MTRKKKLWSKSFGERGHCVCVYEPRAGAPLMRSIYVNGKEVRKALGHRDRELATRQAYEFLAALATTQRSLDDGTVTLGLLRNLYLQSRAHLGKEERTQGEDEDRLERMVRFFGADSEVANLTEEQVLDFISARSSGDASLYKIRTGVAVRTRSVEADLVALTTMFNWAVRAKKLRSNPLHQVKIPREKNPIRPLVTHSVYEELLAVSGEVSAMLPAFLIVAEASGRRLSAVRQLWWSDLSFEQGTVRWRAENDKKGFESTQPMSPEMVKALADLHGSSATSEKWVFPSPWNADVAVSRDRLDQWLRRVYELAGTKKASGGLWHPFRRKWATERKGHSVVDVAAAGGWRSVRTVQMIYQQADTESVRAVLLNPTQRLTTSSWETASTRNRTHNTTPETQTAPTTKVVAEQ
jgi:integrase